MRDQQGALRLALRSHQLLWAAERLQAAPAALDEQRGVEAQRARDRGAS